MIKILFLGTRNTCRSQMAEGFAKKLGKGIIFPFSAGIQPGAIVNPKAIIVMNELGIDISGQKAKDIDNDILNVMNIIITLYANEEASFPMSPPHIKRFNWTIDDPAQARGTEAEIMSEFRKGRDEIMGRMIDLIKSLTVHRS